MSDYNNPIFIVGMNGSGTNMLADCLNNHPLIYFHKHESKIIPYFHKNIHRYGCLEEENNFNKLFVDFSNDHAFRICNNNLPLNIPYEFNSLKQKTLSTVIHLTFSYFAQNDNKLIWGDHSPRYALSIPELVHLFPKCKIIHIVRDGRACAESFNRRFGQNVQRSAMLWKNLVVKARNDGLSFGEEKYIELKYEEITENPTLIMNDICAFLKVPFDKRVLISNMPMYGEKVHSGKPNESSIVSNSGKWSNRMNRQKIRNIELIAGSTLHMFGYDVLYERGDKDVSKYLLMFWKIFDKFYATIDFFHRYDKNKEKIFGTFIRRAKNTIRSW